MRISYQGRIIPLVFLLCLIFQYASALSADANEGLAGEKDYNFIWHQANPNSRYLAMPNLGDSRWKDGVVKWWYNPTGQNISTDLAVQAISEAASAWEKVSGIWFVYQGITTHPLSNQYDNMFVIGWVDGQSVQNRFGSSFTAYASIWWGGQYILDGEVTINSWAASTSDFNSLRGIMTHEFGHIIGLAHSDDPASIMCANPYHTAAYMCTLRSDDITAASALYPSTQIAADNQTGVEAFVTRFYHYCLGREPDLPGLIGWENQLANGLLSGADVAYCFVFSDEFTNQNTTDHEFVTILYRAFFAREPDSVGFNGWLSALNNGASREETLNGFINSEEFYNLCAGYGIAAN